MSRDTKLIAVVVLLLIAAAALFAKHFMTNSEVKYVAPPSSADLQKQIQAIQNDPHMPQMAKDVAIGQLKAHSGGAAGGGVTR